MKNDFRSFFAQCKPFLKINAFLKIAGINQSAFSRFMKGRDFDYEISPVKLQKLYDVIIEWCDSQKIA